MSLRHALKLSILTQMSCRTICVSERDKGARGQQLFVWRHFFYDGWYLVCFTWAFVYSVASSELGCQRLHHDGCVGVRIHAS